MGRASETLTVDEVVEINRRMIDASGGSFYWPDNLQYSSALEYILGALDVVSFGQELYLTIYEKAAALCWHIITRHVFWDGNKRTGFEAARQYLWLNDYMLHIEESSADEVLIEMGVGMLTGLMTEEDLVKWFEERTERVSDEDDDEEEADLGRGFKV